MAPQKRPNQANTRSLSQTSGDAPHQWRRTGCPPNQSGVDNKFPATLPPNLIINGNGKGKERERNTPSTNMDELVAHTIAMDLER